MIANGVSMKCDGQCEIMKNQMGDYPLETRMFAIGMDNCAIILGFEWMRRLDSIIIDNLELYMHSRKDGNPYTQSRLTTNQQLQHYGKYHKKGSFLHYSTIVCYSSL